MSNSHRYLTQFLTFIATLVLLYTHRRQLGHQNGGDMVKTLQPSRKMNRKMQILTDTARNKLCYERT